jgi:RNA 3'-terminal phosphate cyclase (ATP)
VSETVQIEGSYGEGGGQIIRTCLSLSIITGRAVEIRNVRAGRKKPGLQPQHLTAVRAAAELCAAKLSGDSVGSTYLWFGPSGSARPDRYRFDIRTAGAGPLVLQTLLMPLARAEASSKVVVIGGTHVPHAPPAEYLEAVYLPVLAQAGMQADFAYPGAGFYPRGGGQVELEVRAPAAPQPLNFTVRGRLRRLRAVVLTANLPTHVAERGTATVEKFMRAIGRKVAIERRERPSPGAGAAVALAAECEGGLAGFSAVGERGKPMERVAEEPCEAFLAWWKSGAAVDEPLADHLVLPMALAAGESRWTTPVVTQQLRTVLWVAQQFLPVDAALEERADGTGAVTLRGAG